MVKVRDKERGRVKGGEKERQGEIQVIRGKETQSQRKSEEGQGGIKKRETDHNKNTGGKGTKKEREKTIINKECKIGKREK